MDFPSPVFIGYFPKLVAQKKDLKAQNGEMWLKNDIVEEICSVSDCISDGPPDGWIDQWKHNDLGFFPTEIAALSVIPEDGRKKYELFAYKLYPIKFDRGEIVEQTIESKAEENLSQFVFIGFDIVSKSVSDFFECSPLSCGCGCEIFPVNQFCLIQNFDEALGCWKKISEEVAGIEMIKRPDGIFEWHGKWEPGPYYLFQVFRKNK